MADRGGLRFSTARNYKIEELLTIYDGIIDDADKVLEESQIAGEYPKPELPDGLDGYLRWSSHKDPLPPDDMTEVPDLVVGKLFSHFSSWTNYVSAEASRAKNIRDVQERHLKVIKSALAIYYREEQEKPAGIIEDYINTDERYVTVDAALLRIKVFYDTASNREEQLKRSLNNISREQTRRKEELERLMHDERGGFDPTSPDSNPGGGRRKRFGDFR